MKTLKDFNSKIEFVLTDIDDTLTTEGQLHSNAYDSLWKLHDAGLKIIPITGRPAGWCEMIARFWPVHSVVGENGAFYFLYNKKMKRWFFSDEKTNKINQEKLWQIQNEILTTVQGSALSTDQFCRIHDLAIDFCEDVTPLDKAKVNQIVEIFKKHGAEAKVSSIHVNGWFGNFNKLSTTFHLLKTEFSLSEADILQKCVFIGDSPNDEPMFQKFPMSFGVANIHKFSNQMKFLPTYISTSEGGRGFTEISKRILEILS